MFFITAKKVPHTVWYNVYFGMLPYCMDMISEFDNISDISDELVFDLSLLIQKLAPKLLNTETMKIYSMSRLYVSSSDEQDTLDSLQNVCADMQNYVLPYLHQFVDLSYYYAEKKVGILLILFVMDYL